jgi:hypothetical protein
MTPLTVVTFKWKPVPGYRSTFGPQAVNILRRMVARHYPHPHTFTCITDDPSGLDKRVKVMKLWPDFKDVPSPHGPRNPSCYRRLKLFSPEMASMLGRRFVCLDLDTVIVGDVTPLWHRPEDFVIWGEQDPRSFYNGSMFMMTAGARRQVYDTFDPVQTPRDAFTAGRFGSDQGVISHVLGRGEATWGRADGVYSYRIDIRPNGGVLPANARMVMFHGQIDPWAPAAQELEWVKAAWR